MTKNIGASVRQRLLNKAREEKRPFQELLQYFAMERFLFRLSESEHARNFILKGALMLRAWQSPEARSTMDIDLLGLTSNTPDNITECIKDILSVNVEEDGLDFDASSIQAETITEAADYQGIRIRFIGALDSARVNMQIDVGFGDVVFPSSETLKLPPILDYPAPKLLCYSKESVIAEKFEAMLKLGELNSRMKDFYDIYLLSKNYEFNTPQLAEAIRRTLEQRETSIPTTIVAFSSEFAEDKRSQWTAFLNRINDSHTPKDFSEITSSIEQFLTPAING